MISNYAAFHCSYNLHEPLPAVHNYCASTGRWSTTKRRMGRLWRPAHVQ